MSEIMNFLKKERLLSPVVIVFIILIPCLGYTINMCIVQERRRKVATEVAWDTVEDFLNEISEEIMVGVYIDSPSLTIPVDELSEFLSLKEEHGADVLYSTTGGFFAYSGSHTGPEDGGKWDIWGTMGYNWFVNLYIFNEDMTIAYRYKLTVFVTVLEIYHNGYHTESWTK